MTPEFAAELGQQHLLGGSPIDTASNEADWCLTTDPHTRNLEPFVFLHIPKTAGSSLRPIIRSLFDEARIYPGVNFPAYEAEVLQRSSTFKTSKVCVGHMTWDAIELLEEAAGSKINVFTLFREPLSHLHSQSAFSDRLVEQGFDVVSGGVTSVGMQVSLLLGAKYQRLADTFAELDGSNAKRLAFRDALKFGRLTLAKRLDYGLKFGIFEQLQVSLDLMSSHFKLPYIEMPEERINASGAPIDAALSLEDERYIDQWEGLFSDFYSLVSRRFDVECEAAFHGVGDIPSALDAAYKSELRRAMQRYWCVSLSAANAWPGFGWEPRQGSLDAQDGGMRRAIGKRGRGTVFALLRKELAYTVKASICYASSEAVANELRVYANGQLLESKVRWFEPGHIFLQ